MALLQISPSWPLSQSRPLHVPFSHMAWNASKGFPCCWLCLAMSYLARLDLAVDPKFRYQALRRRRRQSGTAPAGPKLHWVTSRTCTAGIRPGLHEIKPLSQHPQLLGAPLNRLLGLNQKFISSTCWFEIFGVEQQLNHPLGAALDVIVHLLISQPAYPSIFLSRCHLLAGLCPPAVASTLQHLHVGLRCFRFPSLV